jgi:hypothetical protein
MPIRSSQQPNYSLGIEMLTHLLKVVGIIAFAAMAIGSGTSGQQSASDGWIDRCKLAESNAYLTLGGNFLDAQRRAEAAYAACRSGQPAPTTQTTCTKSGNQIDCYHR